MKKKLIIPIEYNHLQGGMLFSVVSLIKGLSAEFVIIVIAHEDAEIFKIGLDIVPLKLKNKWVISMSRPLMSLKTYLELRQIIQSIDLESAIILTNNVGSELTFAGFGFFPLSSRRVFISRGGGLDGKTGLFLKLCFKSCIAFVATSKKQELALLANGVERDSIKIINDGVGAPDPQEVRTYRTNSFRISVIGYIDENKNQMLALNALKTLIAMDYKVCLNIYGVAASESQLNYKKLLEEKITELNLGDYVNFKGFERDQRIIYSNTDVLISCSLSEGFGRTIIEAMSYGIPSVGLIESGGLLDIITNQIDGILINNDSNQLAQAISYLYENASFYKLLSDNGKSTFLQKFTEDIMFEKYKHFLNSLFD